MVGNQPMYELSPTLLNQPTRSNKTADVIPPERPYGSANKQAWGELQIV